MSLLKRRRSEPSGIRKELTDDEQAAYDVIKSKTNMGILKADLRKELKAMRDKVFNNCLTNLQAKMKIKEVRSVQNKKGHFMAVEYEPSKELTGGVWYSEGHLDTAFIENLMRFCLGMIRKEKVATAEQVWEMVKKSRAFTVELSIDQIKEILRTLILDSEVMRVKSTGSGEYASIPAGVDCYKSTRKAQSDVGGAMVSIPCGVCPRINQCTPDGVISPITCEYYNKWLDF